MRWSKLALAGLSTTALGACGTLEALRPDPVVIAQPVVIPAECRLDPAPRREVVEPPLMPEVGAPAEIARAERVNMAAAFLYWRERANVAEEQADVNAGPQRVCAEWARRQQ